MICLDNLKCDMLGRLCIKLAKPKVLQSIFRNTTLWLPEVYELIAGTSIENIYLYYDLTAVSIVSNNHCIKLLLHISLKSANHHFTLFKLINLPTLVFSEKFTQYIVDYSYFAYLMLTETDYRHCKKGSITIRPANTPVYSAQTLMCMSSLFFHSTITHRVCRRNLLLQHRTPTPQHHGNIWIFLFPTRHQISLWCPDTKDQIHRTITLYWVGKLHNTSEYHITSDEITIFSDLHGTSLAELDTPKFYLPDNISIVTNDEIQ